MNDDGVVGDWIDTVDGGNRDPQAFFARAAALARTTDPLLRAVRERARFYRFRATPARRAARSVLIREAVSRADAAPAAPAIPVDFTDLPLDPADAVDPYPWYPPVALMPSGGDSIGRDSRRAMNWRLPD